MKNHILFFFIIISFSSIYAQQINTTAVLLTYQNDKCIGYNNDLTKFAQGLKYHLPIIKQIEARIGINGSTLGDSLYGGIRNEDLYGLNISTNSFKEIKLQKLVKTAQINALSSEQRVFEHRALYERYISLSNIYFYQKLIAEKQKLDSLLQKKHDILRIMIEKGHDIKIKEVMDTEGDKNAIQLAIIEMESNYQYHINKLGAIINETNFNPNAVDFSNMISIEQIEAISQSLLGLNIHPTIEYQTYKTSLASSKFDYISGQNRQIFNSLRLGYQDPVYLETPRKLNPFNNFTVRVGLTVPLPANNNFKRSDALLDLREAQNEVALTRETLQKDIEIQYFKLQNLFKQFRLTKEKIDKSLLNKLLSDEKLLTQMTPLEIVEGTIMQYKNRLNLLEINEKITSEYLNLLELNGSLSLKPLKNYLSNQLEGF